MHWSYHSYNYYCLLEVYSGQLGSIYNILAIRSVFLSRLYLSRDSSVFVCALFPYPLYLHIVPSRYHPFYVPAGCGWQLASIGVGTYEATIKSKVDALLVRYNSNPQLLILFSTLNILSLSFTYNSNRKLHISFFEVRCSELSLPVFSVVMDIMTSSRKDKNKVL